MPKQPADGPSLEQYVETRFNLLIVDQGKMEQSLRESIKALREAREGRDKYVEAKFDHQEEITRLIKEAADAATTKAEQAQHAHNVASNEWRQTVQDFKDATTTRTEFDRLAADFAAYKLEIAQTVAARQLRETGRQEGTQENRRESRASAGMIISIAVAAATIAALVIGYLRPQPTAQMQVPPGYILVPAPTK